MFGSVLSLQNLHGSYLFLNDIHSVFTFFDLTVSLSTSAFLSHLTFLLNSYVPGPCIFFVMSI